MSSGMMGWKGLGAIALTASLSFASPLSAVAYAQEEPVATIRDNDQQSSTVYSEDCADFVSGGTFNTEIPVKFVADDRALLVDEDGKAAVMTEADAEAKAGAAVEKGGKKVYYTTEKAAENNNPSTGGQKPEIEVFVAEVGGKKFSTMEDAIAAAKNGGTVTLLRDLDGDAFSGKKYINITEAGTDVTIDLAGHKISLNNADTISVSAPNVALVVKKRHHRQYQQGQLRSVHVCHQRQHRRNV